MVARLAEQRDLLKIIELSQVLFKHMKSIDEVEALATDENIIAGALIANTMLLFQSPDSLLVVMEDERGTVRGFLCGRIEMYPPYYAHPRVGAVLSFYPLSPASKPMLNVFDKWAKDAGCTARKSYQSIKDDLGIEAMIGDGMEPSCLILSMPYETGE
jgi:hypothetical protein